MFSALQRNVAFFGGMALTGWLCVLVTPAIQSARGTIGPTLLQSQSPVRAVAVFTGCALGASVLAGFVGRINNAAVGLFVLGFGIYVLAGRTGTVADLAVAQASGASQRPLVMLGVESLVLALVALLGVLLVYLIAGPLRDVEPDEHGHRPHALTSSAAWRAALAGAAVIPVVLLLARSPMKGQMIGVTFVGAMVAGLIGRLLAPHVQPILIFVSPVFFGAVGHLVGAALIRQPLDVAYVLGDLSALNMPMPVDYVAGSLMGASVGIGWARSFLHHEEQPAPAPAGS